MVEEMMEEYQSLMENDVWDIVSKPKSNSVVSSKWIYNIKHVANRSIDKYRKDLWLEGSLRKRELIMKKHLHQKQGILRLEPSWHLHP